MIDLLFDSTIAVPVWLFIAFVFIIGILFGKFLFSVPVPYVHQRRLPPAPSTPEYHTRSNRDS
jgi:hypothetical protein